MAEGRNTFNSPQQEIVDEVRLSFTGLDSDKGIIDVRDLARVLDGWREFWEISTAIYRNRELSTKPLSPDLRSRTKIRALVYKSFDVVVVVVIPLGLMVGYDLAKTLWKWTRALLRRHIESKKGLISRDEAVDALETLARRFQIETTTTVETMKVLDVVDESLNNLVEPIDRSATTLLITRRSSRSAIRLTSQDKRALTSGYNLDPGGSSKGFEKYRVRFIRINTETGKALVTFENPQGLHQMGHEYSEIIDPDVSRPRNIYTRALFEGKPLEVWGRMVKSRSSGRFQQWELTVNLPSEDTPLLDTIESGKEEQ